jgi:hypothetical protein
MPLQGDLSRNSYVKVDRLFTSSRERTETSRGTHEYQIRLRDELNYIVGIELTGYSLPTSIAPSFLKPSTDFVGNDAVDFTLRLDGVQRTFSFLWPNFKYQYNSTSGQVISYTSALQQILKDVIDSDPYYSGIGGVDVSVLPRSDGKTSIVLMAPVGSGMVGDFISFLWGTGANSERSAWKQMGFTQTDTPYNPLSITFTVLSPNPTDLTPFSYCDVVVQEVPELDPLKRIYFDKENSLVVRNDPNLTRTRLLSQPNRVLKTLTIRLYLEGRISAPDDKEHDLNFTVFSMQPEIPQIPTWLDQSFVL